MKIIPKNSIHQKISKFKLDSQLKLDIYSVIGFRQGNIHCLVDVYSDQLCILKVLKKLLKKSNLQTEDGKIWNVKFFNSGNKKNCIRFTTSFAEKNTFADSVFLGNETCKLFVKELKEFLSMFEKTE